MTERQLIEACKKEDRRAQQMLYDRYSPQMFGVCRRYIKEREEAEAVLVDGFFKILTNLDKYSGTGSFEGWMRRIFINESLMYLRKQKKSYMYPELSNELATETHLTIEDDLAERDVLQFLDFLPSGYRTVFNLYVIEGYKHREIAELLGISINTSKSQLILAKKRLRTLLIAANYPGISV